MQTDNLIAIDASANTFHFLWVGKILNKILFILDLYIKSKENHVQAYFSQRADKSLAPL